MNKFIYYFILIFGFAGLSMLAAFLFLKRPSFDESLSAPAKLSFPSGEYHIEGDSIFDSAKNSVSPRKISDVPEGIYVSDFKVFGGALYISDAFKKRVFKFSLSGEKIWESRGEDSFVIPNQKFPIDISPEGELWVANTGKSRLEKLDLNSGKFIAQWKPAAGFEFQGCCNPSDFVALSNGRFATMEKGVRVSRIFEPSGIAKVIAPISSNWAYYEIRANADSSILSICDGLSIRDIKIGENNGQ